MHKPYFSVNISSHLDIYYHSMGSLASVLFPLDSRLPVSVVLYCIHLNATHFDPLN